jgi:exonuclease SbcC
MDKANMNSIKRLQIENFQSHQKTVCVPAENGQLTVITGPSDTGKTVILRALRWLLFNEPSGSDFIRVGASFVRVTAEMESGHVVVRERTKATNRYKIIAPGDDADSKKIQPQVFEGFGGSVPLEVQEITGVRLVAIGDLSINLNLAEQLDGPFLGKSISGGARAKVLGKLAGTEEIDFAGKQLGTDLYRRNQDEKRLAAEIAGLDEQITKFDWLPGMKKKIEALGQLTERLKAGRQRLMRLEHKRDGYNVVQENIYECKAKIERWQGLEQAEDLVLKTAANLQVKKTVVSLNIDLWSCQKILRASEGTLQYYAGIPDAENLLLDVQRVAEINKYLQSLKSKQIAACVMLEQSKSILTRLEPLTVAEPLFQNATNKKQRLEQLKSLSKKWAVANIAALGAQKKLKVLAKIEEAKVRITCVTESRTLWAGLCALKDHHGNLIGKINNARGQAVLWENRVAELEGAYHDLLVDVGICPLCGQEIKSKVKEAV